MTRSKLQHKIIIVSTTISIITSIVIGVTFISNGSANFGQSIEMSNKTIQLSLKVLCEEAEGFCELRKVPSEQLEETSFTIPNVLILHKDFRYPTFVKLYCLRKDESHTMRSYIKIADSPPPIFS